MTLGDWEGHSVPTDERQFAQAEALGYFVREYVHKRTGQQITVMLVCGRPGPISLHTPDVCYLGAGYGVVGEREQYRMEDAPGAEFTTARFAKQGVAPNPLRMLWAWSDRGPWQAPVVPRLTFARSTVLYKVYVIRRLANQDEPLRGDPCLDFLRVLMPELQARLSAED